MRVKQSKKRLAAVMSFVMLLSALLMSITNKTYAGQNVVWDPLTEWMPGSLNQDPIDSLLQQLRQQHPAAGGNAPTPFQGIEDPQPVKPEEMVDLATGQLRLNDQDMSFPTFGPPRELNRSYSSSYKSQKGMFGYGWNIPQERYIQLFADFTITDFQANGSRQNYLYTKNNPDLLVESYNSTFYYPLYEGFYTVQDPQQKTTLTRRGADDYLLVDERTGMRYAFAGYKTPKDPFSKVICKNISKLHRKRKWGMFGSICKITLYLGLDKELFHTIRIRTVSADKAYGTPEYLGTLFSRGMIPLVFASESGIGSDPNMEETNP